MKDVDKHFFAGFFMATFIFGLAFIFLFGEISKDIDKQMEKTEYRN